MSLVYGILFMVVVLAALVDSMTILGIVFMFILVLNGCGRSNINCYNKGEQCHDNHQDHSVPGPQGDRGPSGPAGPAASSGPSGEKGSKGDAGQNCTVVPVLGGAAVSCPGSETVIVRNGVDGEDGEEGRAGTVVAPVKFCPHDAPVYPSKFPEVGFCIDNKLYAVYSANGGFMTEIPPGTYNSNAVGSSCTFVVLTNCRIQ